MKLITALRDAVAYAGLPVPTVPTWRRFVFSDSYRVKKGFKSTTFKRVSVKFVHIKKLTPVEEGMIVGRMRELGYRKVFINGTERNQTSQPAWYGGMRFCFEPIQSEENTRV